MSFKPIQHGREIVAHGFDCGHCSMNAATVANGVLSFKNRHGGEIHANAVDLNQLFKWYVERANKTTIENLEKLLQQAKQSVV